MIALTQKLQHVGLATKVLDYVRDPQVALWRKLSGLFAALYVISPIDVIPDVIPVIGWLDDLGVMSLFTWWMVRQIRQHAARQAELPPTLRR